MEVMSPPSVSVPIGVADSSQAGHARRQALALASLLDFGELRRGQLAIVVTEAAANIAAHAEQGELLLVPWRFRDDAGIDVLALDNGKGIADVGRSLEDGYSTAGSAGQGMGAISRLAAAMQIYSASGGGTALLARVVRESPTADQSSRDYAVGAVSLAVSGETQCGDAWSVNFTPGRSIYIVADGLGHGPAAAEAAREAIRVFQEAPPLSPVRTLSDAHLALARTRGAAVAIAEILHDKAVVNYAGIGNIAGVIHDGRKTRSMVSMNGTLGHSIGRIQDFSYPWEKGSSLIMHSDGLATRWNLDQYPGLAGRHPALQAGILYRDFCRKRDDVTILISRI
jgi:anti-sigma regulatory factor (Ser/Thr protein kinase)